MSLPIPLELVEYAIDSLHDHIHALAACALASRAFLSRARFHIWREVTVPVEADPLHVRMETLLEIWDANPDIAPIVQSLTLKGVLSPQPRHRIQEYWDDPGGTMLLWEKLPNLRVLKFVQLNFSNGLHQLTPFAYSLPNLEELALADFNAVPQRGHPTSSPYRSSIVQLHTTPKLKRLSLTGGWVLWLFLEDLANLLLEPGMHAPLEALDLSCVVKSMNTRLLPHHLTKTLPSQAWAPVIASLAQTLRHCTLGLLAEECYPANLAKLYDSLKQCTLLQSLGLVCDMPHSTDIAGYRPFLILDTLADLPWPFPHLEALSLDLLQSRREPILEGCEEACTKLASAIEDRTRYPQLKRLGVHAKTTRNTVTVEGVLLADEQIDAQEKMFRSCFGRVEAVGVQVEVSVA
ncbi:hypothetical protein GSI_13300 [Ganoderma sinense ZZ0214-1]|uniref:F-box domain-containing protein n=1 Tax=Ganoderma sinense ZZ0214-1 TaxID=1077348 RepID=A0A2G8RV68_9APHY|nr:hypothetical protein GSI_13300 [Ganoderma sinense ZZ0214-1]